MKANALVKTVKLSLRMELA